MAHLQPHQSRNQNRQIKLARYSFGYRRVASLQPYSSYITAANGRYCTEAVVTEQRKNVLKVSGIGRLYRCEASAKRFWMPLKHHDVQ